MRRLALILTLLLGGACGRERERPDGGEACDNVMHECGILEPESPEFHGKLLERERWDFPLCQKCHGEDFAGGTSGVSCLACHADGPTACTTCHDQPPATGSHLVHTTAGALGKAFACSECHVVPARWDAPGHILTADGEVDPPPAEVVLGALAARDLDPPRRTGPPTYDPVSGRCDNVYCHGGALADVTAAHPSPTWGTPGQAACGGCHGQPPADHAQSACASCHPTVVDAAGALATARHLDGQVQLGDESGTCNACHRVGEDPAHARHLAASGLRGPMGCGDCHQVPAAVVAPGHLDSQPPVEVFPPGSAPLAHTGGANPLWDRATTTCSGVYCHGAATPDWTRIDFGEAACGTCHGLPPVGGAHLPTMTISDCHDCHAGTVDGFGNILITGPAGAESSEHIDGNVDL